MMMLPALPDAQGEETNTALASGGARNGTVVTLFDKSCLEGFGVPAVPVLASPALPVWREADEQGEHKHYMFNYHTMMCAQFANGYCPRHKGSRMMPPQCFCFHFESQRRRPLFNPMTGQLRYWDVLCEYIGREEECPYGENCCFAHTREEISFHAAKYKTKFCNDRDCRGQEVCCFAHGGAELRKHALERYSYWSFFGGSGGGAAGGVQGTRSLQQSPPGDLATASLQGGRNTASTGALYHPKVYKHRFCASYPHVATCRRGDCCAFAHTREEIRTPLLEVEEEEQRPAALTNNFFMYRFKTLWCPVGVQHDWQTCVYAHNYQDARRNPMIGYGPRPCPYWKRKETALEYGQRCKLGVRCPYSHGAKEQLYHPSYFKTVTCQDWPNSNCPRQNLCAFWHKKSQQRQRPSADEDCNYKDPLPESRLQGTLQDDFLTPPFKLLNSLQEGVDGYMEPDICSPCTPGVDAPFDQGGAVAGSPQMLSCVMAMPGTPVTPSTMVDTDEVNSAGGSSAGSDIKVSPGASAARGRRYSGIGSASQDDEGTPSPSARSSAALGAVNSGVLPPGTPVRYREMVPNSPDSTWTSSSLSPQWGPAPPWTTESLQLQGFGGQPMMCYVQVPSVMGHARGDAGQTGQAAQPGLLRSQSGNQAPPLPLQSGPQNSPQLTLQRAPSGGSTAAVDGPGPGSPALGDPGSSAQAMPLPGPFQIMAGCQWAGGAAPASPFMGITTPSSDGSSVASASMNNVGSPAQQMPYVSNIRFVDMPVPMPPLSPMGQVAMGPMAMVPVGAGCPPGGLVMPPNVEVPSWFGQTPADNIGGSASSAVGHDVLAKGAAENKGSMPTCNGFIHFRESQQELDGEPRAAARPRSASH